MENNRKPCDTELSCSSPTAAQPYTGFCISRLDDYILEVEKINGMVSKNINSFPCLFYVKLKDGLNNDAASTLPIFDFDPASNFYASLLIANLGEKNGKKQ